MNRNGLKDFAKALASHYGLTVEPGIRCDELRKRLARQVLTCDLLKALSDKTPDALKPLVFSTEPLIIERAADLAQEWRNRRDLASAYLATAAQVSKSLHLDSIEFSDVALERSGTFLSLEQQLLRRVALKTISDPDSARIAENRQHFFWAEQDTELQAEWALVWQAGRLLTRAREIEKALNGRAFWWSELVVNYRGEANWSELDTLQRRVERRASSLEFALATPSAEVEQLVHAVRRRHREVAGAVAERFVRAWRSEGFNAKGYLRQSEIYDRYVATELPNRIAYFLVDALRWELGRELPALLGDDFESRLELAIGTAPSITEVGMAALLPSAASGLQIGGTSKLQVSLHGAVLKNRADRIAYFKERAGLPVVDLKLEDPRGFRRKLKDLNEGPALAVVTSREIDQSGEDESSGARQHMERVLTHLAVAIRKLAEEGFEKFVIAADHGYLYGEDLSESEKIDLPEGRTILPHRRVWVGSGAAVSDHYLLTEVSRFGAASDFEMAVPWNLAGFRTAGPSAYFHGGLSPQEILLPVIVVIPKAIGATRGTRKLLWDVSLGSAKVTVRFLSVRIQARSQGLFAEPWPVVRVEVRAAGEICAIPVSGSYGFQEDTGAVALRSPEGDQGITEVNTVALMLTGKAPSKGTVSIHVVDAATGVELKKVENVEVSLAI
jgi:PglZ domain